MTASTENIKSKSVWVYDLESFNNFFSAAFINIDTEEKKLFYIHNKINQLPELVQFLDTVTGLIGYNNIAFDYPLLHYILNNQGKLINKNSDYISAFIKAKTNSLINSTYTSIREKDVLIKQLDLMAMKHYGVGSARSTSLKALEFALRWDNLQDLPYPHNHIVLDEQVAEILEYNMNDVLATYAFYKACSEDIQLRRELSSTYNMYLMNAPEPKLANELFLHFLSEDMQIDKFTLKDMRTKRNEINLGDCIAKFINFNEPEFIATHNFFKNKVVTGTKEVLSNLDLNELGDLANYVSRTELEYDEKKNNWKEISLVKNNKLSSLNVKYKGLIYYLGTGGLHASTKSGIYRSTKDKMIIDVDGKSFYPNMAIENGFKPFHLGDTFLKRYRWIYNERVKIPKSNPLNAAYKLMLNGII